MDPQELQRIIRRYLTNTAAIAGFEQAITLLINDLQYLDAAQRGYVMASFTASQ